MDLTKIKLVCAYFAYAVCCIALGKLTNDLFLLFGTILQERASLFYLYEAIKMDRLIIEQIKNVDVSTFSSQYGIRRMEVCYGFDYECCKTLYQYHAYHNVKLGSTSVLLENTYIFSIDDDSTTRTLKHKLWDQRTFTSPTGYKIETLMCYISVVAYVVYRLAIFTSNIS